MHGKTKSIAGEAIRSIRLLTVVLMIPAVLSLALVLTTILFFSRTTSRIVQEASLEPLVEVTIPEGIWSAVAGRETFEECGVMELIGDVNAQLDRLIEESGGRLELTVARRTMDTLTSYTQRIRDGLADRTPIEEIEGMLSEVRSVALLIKNMLGDCITQEAESAGELNRTLTRTAIVLAVAEAMVLIFGLISVGRTSRRLQRTIREPIAELEQVTAQLAGGNLEARSNPTDTEEMRDLTASVNTMADHLQELIRQNRMEQENLKKAELRTLQAQINPHFLYNALDTILWQAEDENSQEVIRLTQALSDFFRISLSSGRDWIPVRQELSHLTGYLSIQKVRYRDVLNYEVQVEPQMEDHMILKLVLQPLVENAIYHGIKEHRGGGSITVRGWEQDGWMYFSVSDTGTGMTPERLEAVRRSLSEGTEMPHGQEFPGHSGSGFGLRNVDQRIRLYYGLSEGLRIESGPEGTVVSFRVPVNAMEEEA